MSPTSHVAPSAFVVVVAAVAAVVAVVIDVVTDVVAAASVFASVAVVVSEQRHFSCNSDIILKANVGSIREISGLHVYNFDSNLPSSGSGSGSSSGSISGSSSGSNAQLHIFLG